MKLAVEHHGYTILYSENRDVWTCPDLNVDSATLSGAKKGVVAALAKMRKKAALPVLVLSGHKATEGVATDAKRVGSGRYGMPEGWEHEIGVMATRFGNERPSKRFERPHNIALPTPEVWTAIEQARIARRRVDEATEAYEAACRAIPRITPEDVAELIRVATNEED